MKSGRGRLRPGLWRAMLRIRAIYMMTCEDFNKRFMRTVWSLEGTVVFYNFEFIGPGFPFSNGTFFENAFEKHSSSLALIRSDIIAVSTDD